LSQTDASSHLSNKLPVQRIASTPIDTPDRPIAPTSTPWCTRAKPVADLEPRLALVSLLEAFVWYARGKRTFLNEFHEAFGPRCINATLSEELSKRLPANDPRRTAKSAVIHPTRPFEALTSFDRGRREAARCGRLAHAVQSLMSISRW
jgi:hypothetical protein